MLPNDPEALSLRVAERSRELLREEAGGPMQTPVAAAAPLLMEERRTVGVNDDERGVGMLSMEEGGSLLARSMGMPLRALCC